MVRNALHVSAEGVPVEVRFTRDAATQTYAITVSDRGPGVPPEALKTMFEPFVQAHDGQREGFGLGRPSPAARWQPMAAPCKPPTAAAAARP